MSDDAERWMPVTGFEGRYEVSDLGRVRSLILNTRHGERPRAAPKILRAGPTGNGYRQVVLCRPGKKQARLLHCVVLEAFVGPAPEGTEAAHDDGVRTNCRLSNLGWKTHRENVADKVRHGTRQVGERGSNAVLTREQVIHIRRSYCKSSREFGGAALAKQHGVSPSAILSIVKGVRWPPAAMAN